MTKSYTVEEAGARLPELLAEAASHVVPITQAGQTVAFLITPEQWEMWLETAEIMGNPEAMEAIRRHQAGEGGPTITLDELDALLGPLDDEEDADEETAAHED